MRFLRNQESESNLTHIHTYTNSSWTQLEFVCWHSSKEERGGTSTPSHKPAVLVSRDNSAGAKSITDRDLKNEKQ
jgi:hypothetical protein